MANKPSDSSFFRVGTIGMSRTRGHKPVSLLNAARHNLREIQAELGAIGHIDLARTANNVILEGPATAQDVKALADSLLASVDTSRLKRDHCQAIETLFSLSTGSAINTADYFTRCLAWLKQALSLPVLSAVVHHDESAPHMHVLMLPVKDGQHVGSSPIKPRQLRAMNANFFTQVAGPAGFARAGTKLYGVAKEWGIKAVLDHCERNGLPKACNPLWPLVVDGIKRDPMRYLEALGIELNSIRPTNL